MDMRVYGLITGRGNNTLPNKNIMEVFDRPLLAYPAIEAKKHIQAQNLYISSDDDKILSAGEQYGYKPIKRPLSISGPDAQHADAITHALECMEEDNQESVDILVVMLANSATIEASWIVDAITMIENDSTITSVVPAYKEQDHHPYRAKKIDETGKLVPYFDFENEFVSTNRQELPDNYFLSHNFWVLNVKKSIELNDGDKPWTFLGKRTMPIIVDDCFDVHTMDDIERTKKWLVLHNKV